MLRTTFSKIKRVCSVAFIPRILQGDVKYAAQKKFTKHSMITSQATKSTSSNSGATGNNDLHGSDKNPEVQKSTENNLAEDREKCDRVISKIFPPGDPLYATPTDREGPEQKIEHIKEVEDGIPITFKEQKESDTTNLYYESEPNNYDTRFDDVANKCLQTPPKKADEHILRELMVDHIPDNIDFYPQKPKQSYYSEVLYGKPQVVRYTNETPKTNEQQKVNCLSDLEVDRSFKAELIQPFIFDSISLCENVDCSEGDKFDALEDAQLTPIILNPYASQSFPFHDYAIEDILLENPVEEESMTVTTGVDDVGNNNLIPPNEMDIDSDEHNIREKVGGAITGLAIPGESTSYETQPITNMAEKEFDILYTQPTSGPPGEGTSTLHRTPDKIVKQNTSISSKIKEEKPLSTQSSSISEHQDPNDSDNINRVSSVQEQPFLFNMQANDFADNASTTEGLKEKEIFTRKTIVSYIEGTYKKPIIEIKIPVYNMKETDQTFVEPSVHFRETGDSVQEHNKSASCGRGPPKIPNTENYSNLETTVSHIEVTEKIPITENSPVLNVRLKPEYEGLLRDKKGVHQTEAANCNLDSNLTATGPIPNMVEKETVTLKELLRRIRERHRLELCREYYNRLTNMTMTDACSKPNTLGPNPCKGPDKSPCPPPPKCPPPKKDPCAAKEDPCAPKKKDPCEPKKEEPCPPCPCPCPCQQKDPCAKFLSAKIYDTISLFRIYILPDFRNVNFQYRQYSSQVLSTRTLQIRALNTPILNEDIKAVNDVIIARDYEPWIPIPSWPIPKKEKRRPFVCPKDGCKLLPSPPFDPAFKEKPCVSFPKKKFSLSELFEHPVVNCKHS